MQVRTQAQPDNRLFHGRGRIPMLEVFEGAPMSALKRAVDATNNVLADYGTVALPQHMEVPRLGVESEL